MQMKEREREREGGREGEGEGEGERPMKVACNIDQMELGEVVYSLSTSMSVFQHNETIDYQEKTIKGSGKIESRSLMQVNNNKTSQTRRMRRERERERERKRDLFPHPSTQNEHLVVVYLIRDMQNELQY